MAKHVLELVFAARRDKLKHTCANLSKVLYFKELSNAQLSVVSLEVELGSGWRKGPRYFLVKVVDVIHSFPAEW